ncbi:MAG: hypothetical protein LBC23_03280, partial [Coriobacteriales bacterium]|nr:hypothetical protein [Coriobacteriales bacterium]
MRQRDGLMSVEAAAVIFVIALFVAFLIIALSGYIGKAQNKGYTNEARNYAIAAKAVLGERYARDESMPPHALVNPVSDARFAIFGLSDQPLANEIALLMDVSLPDTPEDPGYWVLYLAGPPSTDAIHCDGFLFLYYPQGAAAQDDPSASSEDYILVTYKMTPYPSDSPDGASDGASESVTAQTLMSSITY